MAVETIKTGPGRLHIGEAGTLKEIQTRIASIELECKTDQDDDVPVLSGDEVPGDVTEAWTLKGTMFSDFGLEGGFVEKCMTDRGKIEPFEFVPNAKYSKGVRGYVRLSPINIGGEVKKDSKPDFELKAMSPEVFDVAPDVAPDPVG
ncbi:hypothetical protein CGZ94_04930 [Enemella evansiae]|uniref:Phage tail protein n=1 Tax=Enemella evansiae TaxID=2016499 RepID=A0A255GKD4_9ACTN|nr:hypothetical protein [Enemella evansiae]OYO16287.1 hypothetical protein CGZ94_04930 [Enemella evansiae]